MANAVQERRARRKAAKSNSSLDSKRSNDPVANRRRNRIDTEKQAKPVDARAKAKEAAEKRPARKKSDPMASSVDAITQRATAKYKKPNVDTFSDMGSSRRKIKTIDVKPDTKKDPMASSVDAITQRALSKVKKKEEPKKTEAKKDMSFGEAFKAARKEGKKEFTWNGNKYHTQTKDEQISMEKFSKGGYKKVKRKMAGGGMLNGKKSRTGSMDYRKGGLFR